MKVLLIDPVGVKNYTIDFANKLCTNCELTVVTTNELKNIYKYVSYFWFNTIHYKKFNIIIKKILRGINYIYTYFKIYRLIQNTEFDIIHIQWLKIYRFDRLMLKLLKKKCKKLVLTAHNAVPHVNGKKYILRLKKCYNEFDKIIVHGNSIKQEFIGFFPEVDMQKIVVEKHGLSQNLILSQNIDTKETYKKLFPKLNDYKGRVILYLGAIFYNKGVDRLMRFWNNYHKRYKNDILIIAGKITEKYKELENEGRQFNKIDNAIYLPKEVSKELHDELYKIADMIVLPYRHASMSGIVFDAAAFRKMLVVTDTGSIAEYLNDKIDSYVIKNNDKFDVALKQILDSTTKSDMKEKGELLYRNIFNNCSWEIISNNIVDRVYQ